MGLTAVAEVGYLPDGTPLNKARGSGFRLGVSGVFVSWSMESPLNLESIRVGSYEDPKP